jgi:hypothetical protein
MTESYNSHPLFKGEDRFAAGIEWVPFRNDSGSSIPPFSVIAATKWIFPDSADGGEALDPFFVGKQAVDPINPYALYITSAIATPPASGTLPNGVAARPTLAVPLLVALAGPRQDGQDVPFRMCGVSSATGAGTGDGSGTGASPSWGVTRDMPGFLMIDLPDQGYAHVVPSFGPYPGQLPSDKDVTQGAVKVKTFIGPAAGNLLSAVSQVIVSCWNPYTTIITTDPESNPRCTFDWVVWQWELIAADPCPPS